MTKVVVEPVDRRMNEYDLQKIDVIEPLERFEDRQSRDEKVNGYENSAFSSDQTITSRRSSGIIVTTKLQENENNEHEPGDNADDEKINEGFEKLPGEGNRVGLLVLKSRDFLFSFIKKQKLIAGYVIKALFLIGFIIYFGFAMSVRYGTPAFPIKGNVFYGNAGFALFLLVLFAVFIFAWEKFLGKALDRLISRLSISSANNPLWVQIRPILRRFSWIGHVLVFVAIALYVGLTAKQGRNFISLIGICVLIGLGTLGSKYPHRIRWQTVLYSFVIQFVFAVIVIRWSAGFQFFTFLGDQVSSFIDNAAAGAIFVFGESFEDHLYVFKITSIIIFLGSVINVLYYLGVMQYIIGKIAWLMQKCLDTTAAESMNAAANIFVGMVEAPLMIMPLVPKMTTSELHAILVGGFATMAGSVLATFIEFGVPANHLIAASVMAAPGALGFAKLLLPETHKSKTSWEIVQNVPLPAQQNIIDALMTGAGNALKICGYLLANLIAFIAVLHFLDVTISWLFNLVHHPEVNFQFILGLLFYPFALVIGVPLRDCLVASKLIGIKVSLNEFIAYQELGKIRSLRDEMMANNTFLLYSNGTLPLPDNAQMLWHDSSVIILTYALCGFANFGAMGISLAALGVFAPSRKRALVQIAPRALIAGNMVSLMTASIAGLLYDGPKVAIAALSSNSTLI